MNYHYVRQAQYKKGFVAPLLLALVALLLIGGGAYIYTQPKQINPPVVTEDVPLLNATSTSQTISTSIPTISSIEIEKGIPVESLSPGSVYPGQNAEIHGTNLKDVVFVKIGNKSVNVRTEKFVDIDTYPIQIFTVPSLSSGVYDVFATNSSGQTSTAYSMKIVTYTPKQGIVYKNTEFGFEITLPASWADKYKVSSKSNQIKFLLPTSEKTWWVTDYPGYGLAFGVSVLTLNDWNKKVADCKNAPPPSRDDYWYGIPCENRYGSPILGRTSRYIFTYFSDQASPPDLTRMDSPGGSDGVMQRFKVLN